MTYTVHAYCVIRVKVVNIEAASHADAIRQADDLAGNFCADAFRNRPSSDPHIDHYDWAEEIVGYLVDEAHDPEFERSVCYRVTEDETLDPLPPEH